MKFKKHEIQRNPFPDMLTLWKTGRLNEHLGTPMLRGSGSIFSIPRDPAKKDIVKQKEKEK